MKNVTLYVVLILLINLGFEYIPLIDLGFGLFSPLAVVAGAVFVARDYAQRSVGHGVLLAMTLGCALSFFMASPEIALASLSAFAISEFTDWLIFTTTNKPFYKRILISSVISTPIDSLVFLYLIDTLTIATFVLMVLSKLIVAIGMYLYESQKTMEKQTLQV